MSANKPSGALAVSHLVIATEDVPSIEAAFIFLFGVQPHYSHKEFVDFVLPSRFRVAFFRPVGAAAKNFSTEGSRSHLAVGITVKDVQAVYARAQSEEGKRHGFQDQGAPKDHPWGEMSFLLIDRDGNKWEVTQSPSEDGLLVNRP